MLAAAAARQELTQFIWLQTQHHAGGQAPALRPSQLIELIWAVSSLAGCRRPHSQSPFIITITRSDSRLILPSHGRWDRGSTRSRRHYTWRVKCKQWRACKASLKYNWLQRRTFRNWNLLRTDTGTAIYRTVDYFKTHLSSDPSSKFSTHLTV